jgi:hypothetical protein
MYRSFKNKNCASIAVEEFQALPLNSHYHIVDALRDELLLLDELVTALSYTI